VGRWIALLVAVPVVAAACGSTSTSTATHDVTTTAAPGQNVPSGFVVHSVPAQHFRVALPADWSVLDATKVLSSTGANRFSKRNPSIARAVAQMGRPGSPIKLAAFDLKHTQSSFTTNASVIKLQVQAPLQRVADDNAHEIQRASDYVNGSMHRRTQRIAAGNAQELRYENVLRGPHGPITFAIDQYFVASGRTLYVLTFTTLAQLQARYAPTFAAAARTFDDS
jgi:hypothetical protein